MYFLLILLGVFVGAFLMCVTKLVMKEGLPVSDAFKVVLCAYKRIFLAFLSGRWNVHCELTVAQCMSDKL